MKSRMTEASVGRTKTPKTCSFQPRRHGPGLCPSLSRWPTRQERASVSSKRQIWVQPCRRKEAVRCGGLVGLYLWLR